MTLKKNDLRFLKEFERLSQEATKRPWAHCDSRVYELGIKLRECGESDKDIGVLQIDPISRKSRLRSKNNEDLTWRRHFVLSWEENIYDCILGNPTPAGEYLGTAFKRGENPNNFEIQKFGFEEFEWTYQD